MHPYSLELAGCHCSLQLGIGKMDAWVRVGRPPDRFLVGVANYLRRVLHDSGFCNNTKPSRLQQLPGAADRSDLREAARDIWTHSICGLDRLRWRRGNRNWPGMASTPAHWAAAQRVGPFDLAAGTRVRFTRGWLSDIEMPLASAALAVSDLDLPPGTTVALCDRSQEIEHLEVPDDRYVAVAGVKLTGRTNFDCGRFRYGSLFENTVFTRPLVASPCIGLARGRIRDLGPVNE